MGSNETVYNMIDITSSVNESYPNSSTKKVETTKGGRKNKKTKKQIFVRQLKKEGENIRPINAVLEFK
jgi:hypothetical protein